MGRQLRDHLVRIPIVNMTGLAGSVHSVAERRERRGIVRIDRAQLAADDGSQRQRARIELGSMKVEPLLNFR